MFYLGYDAARARARTINVTAVPLMEDLALKYCAAFPNRPAAEAFRQVFLLR